MSTPAANFALTPPMVLVVAANSAEYAQIAQCLPPFYRTRKATSLGEATMHLQRLQRAVVVLDPDLPDGDGIEWLRYLRSNPALRDLVVACVTHCSTVRDKIGSRIRVER